MPLAAFRRDTDLGAARIVSFAQTHPAEEMTTTGIDRLGVRRGELPPPVLCMMVCPLQTRITEIGRSAKLNAHRHVRVRPRARAEVCQADGEIDSVVPLCCARHDFTSIFHRETTLPNTVLRAQPAQISWISQEKPLCLARIG